MKRILLLISLMLTSCTNIDEEVINEIESGFNKFLLNDENSHKKGDLRFLNNEGKFINESRRELFNKTHLNLTSDFTILEIYDMFSPDSYYQAIVQKNDKILIFKNHFNIESKLTTKEYQKFKEEKGLLSCTYEKAKNDIDFLIGERTNDATFHFSIHIIKKEEKNINHYSCNNICIN